MTCLSTALPPAAPCPPSLLQSPAHTHSPARFGTCPALSLCHKAAQTASTSSAAAPAPATAPASAAEGSSHCSPLTLHAGGLVVVLPAALVLVVRVPACSRRGTERQEGCYRGRQLPGSSQLLSELFGCTKKFGSLPVAGEGERGPSPSAHLSARRGCWRGACAARSAGCSARPFCPEAPLTSCLSAKGPTCVCCLQKDRIWV